MSVRHMFEVNDGTATYVVARTYEEALALVREQRASGDPLNETEAKVGRFDDDALFTLYDSDGTPHALTCGEWSRMPEGSRVIADEEW